MSHHHHHEASTAHDQLPGLLDLDAEVLAGPMATVWADVGRLARGGVRTVLDLGAGTGAGTFALLAHFPDAQVVAVDASETMLDHLDRRAAHLGLTDRVTTLRADLDQSVPALAPVDLAWASASLHHLADPDRTLPQVSAVIRPGGLFAVVELSGFPLFVPPDTPGGAAEAQAHALLAADQAVDLPTMGSDWGSRLTRAGLDVELDRTVVVDLAPPSAPVVGTYAAAALSRVQGAVGDRLEPTLRAAFAALLDGGPADVRRRPDLHVRTERRLWIARRPAGS